MKARRTESSAKKRILIVDDHPLVRSGLTRVIDREIDLTVCGEAESGPEGLSACSKLKPDVVVIDLSLGKGSGLDLIKDIHAQHPDLPIVALSVHHENLYAQRVIHAGGKGYVMKGESVDVLLAALRKVLNGHLAVSENIVSQVLSNRARKNQKPTATTPTESLSDRELEVFRLIGQGRSTRQIGEQLHIATSTVESYRAAIKVKLGLTSGTELVATAARFVAEELDG